jgi:hypothetical protein
MLLLKTFHKAPTKFCPNLCRHNAYIDRKAIKKLAKRENDVKFNHRNICSVFGDIPMSFALRNVQLNLVGQSLSWKFHSLSPRGSESIDISSKRVAVT